MVIKIRVYLYRHLYHRLADRLKVLPEQKKNMGPFLIRPDGILQRTTGLDEKTLNVF